MTIVSNDSSPAEGREKVSAGQCCARKWVMALPHRVRAARVDDPVDAALRVPHPAVFVSWALSFVALLSLLTAGVRIKSGAASTVNISPALLMTLAAGGAAVALLVSPRLRSVPNAIIGMVLLDAAPPVPQATYLSPADSRSAVALLTLPTMIAAARLAGHLFRSQLAVAVGIAAAMLWLSPDDHGYFDHVIETLMTTAVLVVSSVMVRRVSATTARHIADLRHLALTDKLTGVLNRKGLGDGYADMVNSAGQEGPIGVVSLDIDHFKWFNDTYGHTAGDEVLRLVCGVLQETSGVGSLVARTGGEELVALVHGPAEPVAHAFRAAVASTRELRVTVSIGIVDAASDACISPDSLWQILDAGDRAMCRAKTNGRDRICRGALDPSRTALPYLAPTPQRAAVAQPEVETASTTGSFPGWILTSFGLLGIVSGFVRHSIPSTGITGQFYMTIMVMCIVAGAIVIGIGPLVDRFR
ncbi:MAG: GGDEF domain-containing protein [Nakamurella sp.]